MNFATKIFRFFFPTLEQQEERDIKHIKARCAYLFGVMADSAAKEIRNANGWLLYTAVNDYERDEIRKVKDKYQKLKNDR